MCLKNQCHICDHEYEFSMDELTISESGTDSSVDGVNRWFDGEIPCPKCGEINEYSDGSL